MWIKRAIAFVVLVAFPLLATGAGCSENPAATAKCNKEADGDACQKCCTSNKASGYKFVNGACSCLGG